MEEKAGDIARLQMFHMSPVVLSNPRGYPFPSASREETSYTVKKIGLHVCVLQFA